MDKLKLSDSLRAKIRAKIGRDPGGVVNNGGKYGSDNDEDPVYNMIMGYTTPADIKTLEFAGGIVYRNGNWYIARTSVYQGGKVHNPVHPRFLAWHNKRFPKSGLSEQQESLVQDAERILGGVRVE